MIDIKKIREDFDATAAQLARRGVEKERVQKAKDLDGTRRALIAETETLKAKRNAASKEIGQIAKQGGDIAAAKEEMRKMKFEKDYDPTKPYDVVTDDDDDGGETPTNNGGTDDNETGGETPSRVRAGCEAQNYRKREEYTYVRCFW